MIFCSKLKVQNSTMQQRFLKVKCRVFLPYCWISGCLSVRRILNRQDSKTINIFIFKQWFKVWSAQQWLDWTRFWTTISLAITQGSVENFTKNTKVKVRNLKTAADNGNKHYWTVTYYDYQWQKLKIDFLWHYCMYCVPLCYVEITIMFMNRLFGFAALVVKSGNCSFFPKSRLNL